VIVLGIDPSLTNLGIAALDVAGDYREDRIVEMQVIQTEPNPHLLKGKDDAARVCKLTIGLDNAIVKHRPAALVVEVPAATRGYRAARALALGWGLVVVVARMRGLPLVQVQPLEVKKAMCGTKKAEKAEIILAVERRFSEVPWPEDVSQRAWEHAADAVGAVVAALDDEVIRMVRDAAAREAVSA
jgi:crossover junction endodeoxyribonuclease RuvC